VTALQARVAIAQGDLAAARRWAAAAGVVVADQLTYVREYEHLTLARLLLAEDGARSVAAAEGLVRRLLAAAEDGQRAGAVIEALTLLAAARLATGDRETALRLLRDALARAERSGHVQLFLDAGPEVVAALHALADGDDPPPHVHRVLERTGPAVALPSPGPALVVDLSDRERDVLRLLRSELSGPEIARTLHVSLNTFRTHTKSIYAKLGVNTRRAAVGRAGQLGL
jgi:LuxR family maltose regulon positive regulatory protein